MPDGRFDLAELDALYSSLSPEERDELLQCLSIAASRGGEAMIRVLEELLLCHATEDLLGEHGGASALCQSETLPRVACGRELGC